MGSRGSRPELGNVNGNYPGSYLNGGFNEIISQVEGRDISNEDFVNFTDWLPVRWSIDGGPVVNPDQCEVLNSASLLGLPRRNPYTRTSY